MSWAEDTGYDAYAPETGQDPLWFRQAVWVTKDGTAIALRRMEDRHLFNAYNKCMDEQWQDAMMREMTYRLFNERVRNRP